MGRPVTGRKWSPPPSRALISWQIPAVRLSSHTMALCSGLPVARSHTMVVSPEERGTGGRGRRVGVYTRRAGVSLFKA